MTLSIDLPAPLEEELAIEANREGITISEQATFLLQLMSAISREGRETPFRRVVQGYLRQNLHDADRMIEVLNGLMAICLHKTDSQSSSNEVTASDPADRLKVAELLRPLREWRSPDAHRSLDHHDDFVVRELPSLNHLVQSMGRTKRTSVLGKYAHLKLSTEEIMAEKQREIDREDRNR